MRELVSLAVQVQFNRGSLNDDTDRSAGPVGQLPEPQPWRAFQVELSGLAERYPYSLQFRCRKNPLLNPRLKLYSSDT